MSQKSFNKKGLYLRVGVTVVAASFLFLPIRFALGEAGKSNSEDAEVIETKVDLDSVNMERVLGGAATNSPNRPVLEDAIIKINQNLKNVIAENRKLLEERKSLEEQVKMLRGQLEIEHNRANLVTAQKDAVAQKSVEQEESNKKVQQELEEIKKVMGEKEQEWAEKLKSLQTPQSIITENPPASENPQAGPEASVPLTKMDMPNMIARINNMNRENEQLKYDAAKVHYNVGNILFQKGEYEKARAEYKQAVELMPYDAAAHFNLAFVSGEYLNDPQMALTHYQQYLYLNPQAEDASLVKEKIVMHQLQLKTKIDASIDPLKQKEKEQKKEDKVQVKKRWLFTNSKKKGQ